GCEGDGWGRVADRCGYRWTIGMGKEELSVEEMHRRMAAVAPPADAAPASARRKGFRVVTPYLVVHDVPGLIAFTERAFGAEEAGRMTGGGGGMHAEVQIGDSMLMIGGGSPEHPWRGDQLTAAFPLYVPDGDAADRRALDVGSTSIH